MFVFCQNSHSAATYAELLKDFSPIVFTDTSELKKRWTETDFLIIDDDCALCQEIAKQKNAPTILFISKQNITAEEVSFLQKPITAETLIKKVSLLARQIEKGLLLRFEEQGFTFCGRERTLNGVPLTQKEAELIEFLYENKDRIVTREELLQNIFGYNQSAETHTVETHVYKLRQKIGDDNGALIITKDGGYCLALK